MSFDPFGWWTREGREHPSSPAATALPWLDEWVKATTWWVDPRNWADLAAVPGSSPDRALFDILEGIARRFTGRRVELERRGAALRFVLDSLRIERRWPAGKSPTGPGDAKDVEASLEAHDVDWAGWTLEKVSAVVRQLALVPGRSVRLRAGIIDVTARSTQEALVSGLGPSVAGRWSLKVAGDGLVAARRDDRPLELVVEPSLVRGDIRVELRAVAWRGLRLRVPSWLRLTRTRPVPPLPSGMELLGAWPEDGAVTLRLRVRGLTETLDLARIRDAVLCGEPVLSVGP
jgi:hypothetical protein